MKTNNETRLQLRQHNWMANGAVTYQHRLTEEHVVCIFQSCSCGALREYDFDKGDWIHYSHYDTRFCVKKEANSE